MGGRVVNFLAPSSLLARAFLQTARRIGALLIVNVAGIGVYLMAAPLVYAADRTDAPAPLADGHSDWKEWAASFCQTPWFRAGAVILLTGASSTAAWWQQRHKRLRKLAELERQRRDQAELARASRVALLGELSASLAHELQQPLTAILTNAQAALRFLNDNPADVSEVRDILKDIALEDRRASEIIRRMRAMVEKGKTLMEPRDLNADVRQMLLLLRSDLVERNVSVDTQLSSDLPLVPGDHIQLQQVLLNLVVNGCDAMHANAPNERRLVIKTSREGSDLIHVSIADRGTGIPPEKLESIFEPFYSTKNSGLGMGLAICRAIIKAHGGRLWAANNRGGGATFHMTLELGGQPQA